MMNAIAKTNLGRKKFIHLIYSIIKGSQGRISRQVLRQRPKEECCFTELLSFFYSAVS